MKTSEIDIIFLSYDEPNAEYNYAHLCNIVPWAKRVHGVKGSDTAHKEAALLSDTEWFITVDADNIVNPLFFNLDIDISNPDINAYSWVGRNLLNGLQYGNGGLKVWKKEYVLNMRSHEFSDSDKSQVDFCWEDGYTQFKTCYSDIDITSSPYQAWRAGFREGVKMTLDNGVKVNAHEIKQKIWWHNLHRLKIWATIGSHKPNGNYAILGARMGAYMTNCTDWDYIDVRDFDKLYDIYNTLVVPALIDDDILKYGELINQQLGINWPVLTPQHSQYTLELYDEIINLNRTYYEI